MGTRSHGTERKVMSLRLLPLLLVSLLLAACAPSAPSGPTPYTFDLPPDFPTPRVSRENPITVEKVELGRLLFYDRRLSINEAGSCASCHEQRKAFTDGRARAIGPTGELHPRSAMSLANAVYNSRQNWANPILRSLEQQHIAVLFSTDPVEMGWKDNEDIILRRLAEDPEYPALFAAAFPEDAEPIARMTVVKAIASFSATLISGRAPYDRGEMSPAAERGAELFNSERLECFHCHGAFNFAQSVQGEHTRVDTTEFKNTGLYNIPGPTDGLPLTTGNYPTGNQGLYEFSGRRFDMGRFRAPTLRNIALTAPYMHDGSIATLSDVITEHYGRAGRTITDGPHAGVGTDNPYKDPLLQGFTLEPNELADLLAFFDALTDWDFICNPDFADPFGHVPMHTRCGEQTARLTAPQQD